MNHIGEFPTNSTILLELLTMNEENQTIPTDFPPSATIEHYERNGLQEVDNVKLETMADEARHVFTYEIPSEFKPGNYLITYRVMINGHIHSTQETFTLSSLERLVQEENQLGVLKSFGALSLTDEAPEEMATDASGYIMPADFGLALAKDPEVNGNQLTFTLGANMKYNHTYRVVLNEGIRSMTGQALSGIKTITFTSEYKPLFATSAEVQSLLRSTFKYFTPHDVYGAIRDAGEKAMQLLGNVPDANNSRYRDLRETDTAFFSTQKYVAYEAARSLMTALMVRILNGVDDEETAGVGTGMINETGGSISLGDFSVADKASSSSGIGGSAGESKEESPLKKLQTLLSANEKELKFWLDSMMGRNRRGYASPVSGSFRTAAGSPEGRDWA